MNLPCLAIPFPVADFGQILTDLVDILLVLHQLVVHLLNQVRALVAQLRQIQPHHVGLLVGDVVEEAQVLMGVAVVVLLPHVGGKNQVEGGNALPLEPRFDGSVTVLPMHHFLQDVLIVLQPQQPS